MEFFISCLDGIWKKQIKQQFFKGLIPYERQLQAELYSQLKSKLSKEYKIWVEPVLYLKKYGLDKIKPDLIITKGKKIIAVMELKLSPWQYARTAPDLAKFKKLMHVFELELPLDLIWIPKFKNSNKQFESHSKEPDYKFDKKTLMVSCVVAKSGSNGLLKATYDVLKNFRLYYGYIEEGREPIFDVE